MAGQVLGYAVDDEVDAVLERAGVAGRGKGCVDDGAKAVALGDVDEAGVVEAAQEGIGRGLGEDQLRFGPDCRFERVVVARRDDGTRYAEAGEKGLQKPRVRR